MNASHLQIPDGMAASLQKYQRSVWFVKVAEGLLAGLFGLLLSYLVVFCVDRVTDSTGTVRLAILLTGSIGLAILFPLKLHRWVWGTRRMEQVAGLLKHKFPRLGDQLLGIVELARNASEQQRSPVLVQAAMRQVDEQIRDRDFSDAVPKPRHKRWALATFIPAAFVIGALIFIPSAAQSSLVRWLMPWKDSPRFTFAQLEDLPAEKVVPYAEQFEITARLKSESEWKPNYATATLGSQSFRVTNANDAFLFESSGQLADATLHLRVGDATKSVQILPKQRPELTQVTAKILLPNYLQYSHPLEADVRGGSVSILKGSRAIFCATASRELAEASADNQPIVPDGAEFRTSEFTITDSTNSALSWKDVLGLSGQESFNLRINAIEDTPPRLQCERLDKRRVLLSTETLKFDVSVLDDFGIRRVGLEWKGIADPLTNPEPQSGERLLAGGSPEKTAATVLATFSARTEKLRPQRFHVRAYAEDYLPDRERVYSPVYVVDVMSPDEHAIWMSEQLRRWFDSAESVYEEERRLHETNRALRRLSTDQLDRADVRRKIEGQAVAERANAARLESTTQAGRDLIEEALRNEEIRADQIKAWAEMLKDLDKIAAERMPSVAELLDQAAQAPGAKPADASGKAQEAGPSVGNDKSQSGGTSGGSGDEEEGDPNTPAPSTTDRESDLGSKKEQKPSDKESSGSSSSSMTIPQTELGPAGDSDSDPNSSDDDSAAQENVDNATEEQAELLEEFDKVRDKMQGVMDTLENSTFVKRLKAASRLQLDVATDLNKTVFKGFGRSGSDVDEKTRDRQKSIGEREVVQSNNIRTIQSDLEVYFNRRQEKTLESVLNDMKEQRVITKVAEVQSLIKSNMIGESISRSEYWADSLDRWAEELVPPAGGGGGGGGDSKSLPPSIVLEVMRIIDEEMDLRDETRGLEQAKSVMDNDEYNERAMFQTITQLALQERTLDVMSDIKALPEGESNFGEELGKLGKSVEAMDEAQQILSTPNTGEEAIAAETEAIEMLLESRRANPNGGGGGGGNSPGGGGSGSTDRPALDLVGPGSDRQSRVKPRQVGDATGNTGRELPEEFRDGLDAFFNALSKRSKE